MRKSKSLKVIISIFVIYLIFSSYNHFLYHKYSHLNKNEISHFPLHAQPDTISCGPTCAKMVLEKYGFKIDLQTIKKHAKTEWYKGKIWGKESEIGLTTPDYLQLAMNNLGIKSEIKRGSVDQLKYYVDQKRPPVVLVRSGKNLWHYVVVIGYTEKTMIVADPSGGRREIMSNKIFINSWNYSTDMSGKEISKKCEICNGTGKISFLPNPFGKCDSCGGTGRLSDLWLNLYLLSGYSNNMMIIPKKSFGD